MEMLKRHVFALQRDPVAAFFLLIGFSGQVVRLILLAACGLANLKTHPFARWNERA